MAEQQIEQGDVARAALEQVLRTQQKAADVLGQPDFTQREASWLLTVTDEDGTTYTGIFRSRFPGEREKMQIELTQAQLLGGIPFTSASPHLRRHLEMLATFAVCLVKRPGENGKGGWFDDPDSFMSETVPAAVYGRIVEHFTTFREHRRGAAGAGAAGATPGAAA